MLKPVRRITQKPKLGLCQYRDPETGQCCEAVTELRCRKCGMPDNRASDHDFCICGSDDFGFDKFCIAHLRADHHGDHDWGSLLRWLSRTPRSKLPHALTPSDWRLLQQHWQQEPNRWHRLAAELYLDCYFFIFTAKQFQRITGCSLEHWFRQPRRRLSFEGRRALEQAVRRRRAEEAQCERLLQQKPLPATLFPL